MLAETQADIPMPDPKPARSYVYKAIPAPDGFYALWASPGLHEDYVYEDQRRTRPRIFKTQAEAEYIAMRTMINALNARNRNKAKEEHLKLTGPEFAVALAEANISLTEIAQMWGSNTERVMQWIDGDSEKYAVPFPFRWILPVLRLPGALDLAREITGTFMRYKPDQLAFLKSRGLSPTAEVPGRITPKGEK